MDSAASDADERMDDGLLVPIGGNSYNERENGNGALPENVLTGDKVTKKTLPDARAKVLHLQRVQRAGESSSSSNDSSKSSKNKAAPAANTDEEKEETVNFSLDTIIRRGLNEQKINTNFKNPFKFSKPDDNISLRVNPSANYFYEHDQSTSSDSESESVKSDRRPQQAASDEEYTANDQSNQVIERTVVVAQKRKRGRPKMSDEEKAAKRARDQSLLQAQSLSNSIEMATPVDELMAMGHSIFSGDSEYVPKKRGRRRKNQLPNYLSANDSVVSMETDHNNDTAEYNDVVPQHKKRGRKPKAYYEALAAAAAAANHGSDTAFDTSNAYSDGQLDSTIESNHQNVVALPKRRGRKPKYAQHNYVANEFAHLQSPNTSSDIYLPSTDPNQPEKKKRGRRPKTYYLALEQQRLQQQQQEQHELGQPFELETTESTRIEVNPIQYQVYDSSQVNGLHEHFATLRGRKGRKPKGYHEWLIEQKARELGNASLPMISSHEHSYVNAADTSALSEGALPVAKKRGRKPKAFYEAQRRQQELMNSQESVSNEPVASTSYDHQSRDTNGHVDYDSSVERRMSRPTIKLQTKRVSFAEPRTLDDETLEAMRKRKGRKPKIYYETLAARAAGAGGGNSTVDSSNTTADGTSPMHRVFNVNDTSTPRPIALMSLDGSSRTSQDRNRSAYMEILDQRGEEVRILKMRLTNVLRNEKNNSDARGSGIANEIGWCHAELCKAFSLQRFNIPLFNHMCAKFSVPLPQDEDINRFVQNVQIGRGLQTTMLQILENSGELYRDHERVAGLQVSSIRIAEKLEYDERSDSIWGPHEFLTAIVARGLYSDWSQLIYVNFDVRVTKEILNSVIEALHKINFSVAACSCNFTDTPNDLWTQLNISLGKNFFLHPITNEQIVAFYYIDDLLAATNKQFIENGLSIDDRPISRTPVLQAIQKNYRRIALDKGLLLWADADCNNVDAIRSFFTQYTVNLVRLSAPITPTEEQERSTKSVIEFLNMIKTFVDIMNRQRLIETDTELTDFDLFLESQNKKLDKVHARLFKLKCTNQTDPNTRKFRDAIMMSLESLKMLRKSVLLKYKYPTFSTAAITNEFLKQNFTEITMRDNCNRLLAPLQALRVLKEIFLGESSAIKLEPTEKFFYVGPVTAAEVNGRNEQHYVMHLISWLCEKYQTTYDAKDLKRKLKKAEEAFCVLQKTSFRIWDGAVAKVTRQLVSSYGQSMYDVIRTFVLQRHLLRIKYLNENGLSRIPMPVPNQAAAQVTINLE